MLKRFTDIHKWEDPWYRKLAPKHKLLWQYICDKCDNVGIWKIDYELASFQIGTNINEQDILKFNDKKDRIIIHREKLLIKDFIPFQIGKLDGEKKSNLQKNCLDLIKKYNEKEDTITRKLPVSYGYGTGIGKGNILYSGSKKGRNVDSNNISILDTTKTKANAGASNSNCYCNSNKNNIYSPDFEKIWKIYPNHDGKKAAFRHFQASVKTEKDLKNISKALRNYMLCEKVKNGYIKNGSTWFNNWEDWIDYTNPIDKEKENDRKYFRQE